MYSQKIVSEFNLKIKIAGEIEFYLAPPLIHEQVENEFQAKVLSQLVKANINIWSFQNEVAPSQYEIALQPKEPEMAIVELKKLKEIITDTAKMFQSDALFKAKPYENLPGCGLHIHIGIVDLEGNSVCRRKGSDKPGSGHEESDIMLFVIAGLCSTMLKNFIYFAPYEDSYLRFSGKRNELINTKDTIFNPLATYNNAPINVSWGGNNRTTAIRIPVSTVDETNRHIEHRVSGADADPEQVINAILEGIYVGLKNKILPPEKIYGNAFDKQYDFLVPFPKNLECAKN